MGRTISQKYLIQHLNSASPARLVAMLLDRAVTLLNEAIDAMEGGQIERRWRANSKAMEIICHLWETLDFEQGGEIATNLERLYRFMIARLTAVDVDDDAQAAREVIGLLEPLRRSWHELADRSEGETAAVESPAAGTTQISLSA